MKKRSEAGGGITRNHGRRSGIALTCLSLLFLCAFAVGGCRRRASAPLASATIKPFKFDVALGAHRYLIDGYVALSPKGGRLPAVLILNAGQGDAKQCVATHGGLGVELGVQVACVSLPGYGHSSGPDRLVGPQAVATGRQAFDLLAARSDVDPNRIAVWGIGEGAVAAGLFMDDDPRVRNVILQSGAYDMLKLWPKASLANKLRMLHQVWPSRRILRERSVIEHLRKQMHCNVLIIHGAKDRQAPIAQAVRLGNELKSRGANVSEHVLSAGNHDLGKSALGPATDFLRETLLKPSATDAHS